VVQRGRFSVSVYPEVGVQHHEPHCHVRWPDGSAAVRLPDLTVLAGDEPPTAAKDLLREHRELLKATWNDLNPERRIP